MLYIIITLLRYRSQHWFRQWLVAWRHQAIAWTNEMCWSMSLMALIPHVLFTPLSSPPCSPYGQQQVVRACSSQPGSQLASTLLVCISRLPWQHIPPWMALTSAAWWLSASGKCHHCPMVRERIYLWELPNSNSSVSATHSTFVYVF